MQLLTAAIAGNLDLLRKCRDPELKERQSLHVFSILGFVALLAMFGVSAVTGLTRSSADFYLKWPNTYAGRQALSGLQDATLFSG